MYTYFFTKYETQTLKYQLLHILKYPDIFSYQGKCHFLVIN